MTIPAGKSLGEIFREIRNQAQFTQLEAQNALSALQSSVDSDWVFQFLIQMKNFVDATSQWSLISGLDAYATANMPNYSGSLTADIADAKTKASACITWVFNNFPKDAGGYAQAYTINADGTHTPSTFTSAQTAGLRTALINFIAAIG